MCEYIPVQGTASLQLLSITDKDHDVYHWWQMQQSEHKLRWQIVAEWMLSGIIF